MALNRETGKTVVPRKRSKIKPKDTIFGDVAQMLSNVPGTHRITDENRDEIAELARERELEMREMQRQRD